MRRYVIVSGIIFTLVALVQLARTLIGVPVVVYGIDIPRWPSGIAFLIAGSLAIWAFRAAGRAAAP